MLIGIIKNHETIYLPTNLDKKESIKLDENDLLIYIKY